MLDLGVIFGSHVPSSVALLILSMSGTTTRLNPNFERFHQKATKGDAAVNANAEEKGVALGEDSGQ